MKYDNSQGEFLAVFLAFQTLLSVNDDVRKSDLKRSVPVEGYYAVVTNPWNSKDRKVVFNGGFVYVPDTRDFHQKDQCINEYVNRTETRHGIAPCIKYLSKMVKVDYIRKSYRFFEDAKNLSKSQPEDIFSKNEGKERIRSQLEQMLEVVEDYKDNLVGGDGSKVLFLTLSDRLPMVEAALNWFRDQGVRMPEYSLFSIDEFIPATYGLLLEADRFLHNSQNRCAMHPVKYTNKHGKPFDCCKADVKLLLNFAEELSNYLTEQDEKKVEEVTVMNSRTFRDNGSDCTD